MIYFIILLLFLYLSYSYDVCGRIKGKKIWYVVIQLILILLSGLRYRVGIDTISYLNLFYYSYPSLSEFSIQDYPLGFDPLYVLLNSIVISYGGRFYIVQFIHAIFTITLIFKYVTRYTQYIFTFSLFYFILCFFEYNLEIMRAALCIVIGLYGNDYILKKKWIKGCLLYLIASLFHAQGLFFFLLPLIMFLKLNKKAIVALVITFFISRILQNRFEDYLGLIEIADFSIVDDWIIRKQSFWDIFVYNIPFFIYTTISIVYVNTKVKAQNLISIQPFVMIGLFCLVIQMNMFIAYRFTEFFYVYMIIYLSHLFVDLAKRNRSVLFPFKYILIMIIFTPFFYSTWLGYQYKLWRYPYASVIERKIDQNRERELSNQEVPVVSYNDY